MFRKNPIYNRVYSITGTISIVICTKEAFHRVNFYTEQLTPHNPPPPLQNTPLSYTLIYYSEYFTKLMYLFIVLWCEGRYSFFVCSNSSTKYCGN